jgi:hypothetical protein
MRRDMISPFYRHFSTYFELSTLNFELAQPADYTLFSNARLGSRPHFFLTLHPDGVSFREDFVVKAAWSLL